MNYSILKLNLDSLPWSEFYDANLLVVKGLRIPKQIDNRYADDKNYGLYTGDDTNAYFHARGVYNDLKRLKCLDESDAASSKIVKQQEMLLKDIENYLQACSCLLIVDRKRIETLLKIAGEVCCNEKLLIFIRGYWGKIQEYRSNNRRNEDYFPYDNLLLDFPELYMAMGDRLLYEKHDIDLAVEFYQLSLLDWKGEKSSDSKDALQEQILNYKCIQYKRYSAKTLCTSSFAVGELYRHFGGFYRVLNASVSDIERIVEEAESFADLYLSILNDTFYSKSTDVEYKVQNKEDFRICYMMALLIYNDAYLWTVFHLFQSADGNQENEKEDIIRGLQFNSMEYLQVARDYWAYASRTRGSSQYQNLLLLLQETAYVEIIRDMLREKNPKQDIAYYTSLDTLRYLLPERAGEKAGRLSIMHVAYMNDPNEGKTLWSYCGGIELAGTVKGQRRSAEYPYVFLKCFTPLIDDLPMWEMYGDHAAGCCIVFKKAFLRSSRLQVPLYRVCYLRKKNSVYELCVEDNPGVENNELLKKYLYCLQNIYNECRRGKGIHSYFKRITESIIFLFKDANYQHEQELRIMYSYTNISKDFLHIEGEYPKLYLNPEIYLRIQEIILGPKVQDIPVKVPYLQEELAKLSNMLGVVKPIVSLSEIEYQ